MASTLATSVHIDNGGVSGANLTTNTPGSDIAATRALGTSSSVVDGGASGTNSTINTAPTASDFDAVNVDEAIESPTGSSSDSDASAVYVSSALKSMADALVVIDVSTIL